MGSISAVLANILKNNIKNIFSACFGQRGGPREFVAPCLSVQRKIDIAEMFPKLNEEYGYYKEYYKVVDLFPLPDDGRVIVKLGSSAVCWDVDSNKSVWIGYCCYDGPSALSPNGRKIVFTDSSSTIYSIGSPVIILDVADGELIAFYHEDFFYEACAVSSDSRSVMVALNRKNIMVFLSMRRGRPFSLRTLRGHDDLVKCCAFSPDGQWFVSGSRDHTLIIWETRRWKIKYRIECCDLVYHCVITPDSQRVMALVNGELRVWHLATGRRLATKWEGFEKIHHCALSADGRWLVTVTNEKKVRLLDQNTLIMLDEVMLAEENSCCAFFPDSLRLAVGGERAVWFLAIADQGDLAPGFLASPIPHSTSA